jgi:selenocysteine lyase/cysteine desulfurase
MLGAERKQKRLHYLKNYWMEKVKQVPGVQLHSSLHSKWSCAIGMVSVEERKSTELDSYLYNQHKIHCVAIDWENIQGVRITPNVYTTTRQLDTLVTGITNFARSK